MGLLSRVESLPLMLVLSTIVLPIDWSRRKKTEFNDYFYQQHTYYQQLMSNY